MNLAVARHSAAASVVPIVIAFWAAFVAIGPDAVTKAAVAIPALAAALLLWTLQSPARWLVVFFAVAVLTPPLPLPVGGTGPHVAPAVAAVGMLIGLIHRSGWRPVRGAVPKLLAAFMGILLASVLVAFLYSGWAVGAGSLARFLLLGIAVYVFFYTLAGPGSDGTDPFRAARILFAVAIAAATFACVDFYYQLPAPAGYGAQFVWLPDGVFRRAQGLFYDASTLGNFCALFLVMVIVGLFRPAGRRPCARVMLLIGGVLLCASLIFSYSRASLFAVFVATAALCAVQSVHKRRTIAVFCSCIAAAAVLAYLALPALASTYWFRLSASLRYVWSSPDGVLSGRLTTWSAIIDFLAGNPWHGVLGIGYKTLPYSDILGRGLVGDNMYLTLLVETGVVGLGLFVALNIAILRAAYRAARCASPRASFFGAWIFSFWVGETVQMLSGDLLTYWRVLPICFWILATAIRESGQDVPFRTPPNATRDQ